MLKSELLGFCMLISLFMVGFLIVSSTVQAVSITDLSIMDVLKEDLSMRETILLHVENNTDKEFKLVLPDIAYNITLNGIIFNNNTLSEEIACENCSAEISYSFPRIIVSDSGNYTFYRKIEMPINVSALKYSIVLPENHALFNTSDLQTSIIPDPTSIIGDYRFEWYYDTPEFPKEFAVRYKEIPMTPSIMRPLIEKEYIQYIALAFIILIVFILGITIGLRSRKKKEILKFL